MLYHSLVLLSNICCVLPEGFTRFIGKIIGNLTWYLVPKKRKVMAVNNIKRCLKVDEVRANQIAKKVMDSFWTNGDGSITF